MLRVFLFGPPRIELNNQAVPLRRTKSLALLAYLVATQHPQDREALLALLWPEFDETSARNNLRRELSLLKSVVGEEILRVDRLQVAWNNQAVAWVDVAVFEAQVAIWKQHRHAPGEACASCVAALTTAAQLYTDDFLASFSHPDSSAFDEWQFFEREELREQLRAILQSLIGWYKARGEYDQALPYARRWLALDSLHEQAQRELMRLYAWSGQHSAALRQYENCVRLLEAELGAEPETETTELAAAIKMRRLPPPLTRELLAHSDVAFHFAGARSADTRKHSAAHNLPAQPTPFIGREKEIAEIRHLLLEEQACRMVTLLGPGGIGKTRLALAAAGTLVHAFPHGVSFVSLSPLTRAEFIISAVAEALGLTFSGGLAPKVQLLNHLRGIKLLLILDNFEHLINPPQRESKPELALDEEMQDAAGLLSEILSVAPEVMLLVTSRERLNLQEEWSYELQGMVFPTVYELASATPTTSQLLADYSAVQLFLQRARRTKASFTLTVEDMPHVIRICQLLEGMPLGLELAASWIRLMTCQEIVQEIQHNLDFLTTPMRNLPERHQSLRAVFEQTWQRLPEVEQLVLSKLSVFTGGCLREAAEAVAGASLSVLASLVDKALLRRTSGGRYELHELVRQYAADKLQHTFGKTEVTQAFHAYYYAAFLQQHEADLKGARQLEGLAEIAAEIDNVRTMWRWTVDRACLEVIAKSQESLYLFYEMQGQAQEGVRAFQRAVAVLCESNQIADHLTAPEYNLVLGQLIGRQGFLANRLGLFESSVNLMRESVVLLRQVEPEARGQLALSLYFLGGETYFQGKHTQAKQLLWEGLTLATEVGDRWLIGVTWQGLGQMAEFQGEYTEAVPFFQQSIDAFRQIGERRWRSSALNNRGRAAYAMGAYAQAEELIGEALEIRQALDDRTGIGYSLLDLGKLATLQGQYVQARHHMQQSLAICEQIGDRDQVARCMNGLGAVYRLLGDFDQAEAYHQSSLAIYNEMGIKREIPFTLSYLGQVAYDQGDYQRAEQRFLESLKVSQALEHTGGTASALRHLGHVAGMMERDAEARQYYRQALAIVTKTGAVPIALDVLLGWAMLLRGSELTNTGREQSLELLSLVAYHPAAPFEIGEKARKHLRALAAILPAELLTAAEISSRKLNWEIMSANIGASTLSR